MPKTDEARLTAQQRKWFASVQGGLERDTGKSLAEWVAIARTCPETGHRARLKWFKDTHGLLQNRASHVLGEAFPPETPTWREPDALREALWTDPAQRALFEAVEAEVKTLPDVIEGQRKGYSAWSRNYQFAAVRPVKGGVRVGFAVTPNVDPRLEPAKPNEGWSERLKAVLVVTALEQIDASVSALLKVGWDKS